MTQILPTLVGAGSLLSNLKTTLKSQLKNVVDKITVVKPKQASAQPSAATDEDLITILADGFAKPDHNWLSHNDGMDV